MMHLQKPQGPTHCLFTFHQKLFYFNLYSLGYNIRKSSSKWRITDLNEASSVSGIF